MIQGAIWLRLQDIMLLEVITAIPLVEGITEEGAMDMVGEVLEATG